MTISRLTTLPPITSLPRPRENKHSSVFHTTHSSASIHEFRATSWWTVNTSNTQARISFRELRPLLLGSLPLQVRRATFDFSTRLERTQRLLCHLWAILSLVSTSPLMAVTLSRRQKHISSSLIPSLAKVDIKGS